MGMKMWMIRMGLAVLLTSQALSSRAAVSFVQEADQMTRSVSFVTQGFSANTAPGNLIVVGILYDASVVVRSVADAQGSSFVAVGNPVLGSVVSGNVQTYYARNIHGGPDTVTVALSGVAVFADVYIHEYSGADTTNPLDNATGAAGTGSIGSSGPLVTSSPNDLIFGFCADGGGVPMPGAGFTLRSMADNNISEDRQALAAGSYAVTIGVGGTYDWACQLAAFRSANSTSLTGPAPVASPATESVTLSGKFNWDNGTPIQGSVSLVQQTASGDLKIGQWPIGAKGYVSASILLHVWGFYRFEIRDIAGALIRDGAIVAFPSLQSGNVHLVLSLATRQVMSTTFTVAMGDLVTTAP